MKKGNPAIKISALHKRYKGNKTDTLKGVNLSINQGEFYGILGPNSAGKTSLISVMCGLLKYNSGQVFIDQEEVQSAGNSTKSKIGLVPQEVALYPKLTVRENMAYFGQMYGIFGKKLAGVVDKLLDKLQLHKQAEKQISRCSGGIKRRTNIAAGMIHQPQILILDEPTVGVDAQSRNLIFEYLKQLNQSGRTILYTTHYLDEAEVLCTNVSIIDNGLIVENGSPKNLINKHDGCNDLGDVFLKITGKALRE